jgi:hypothetical protein
MGWVAGTPGLCALPITACLLCANADALAQGKLITLEQTAGRTEERVNLRGSRPSWRWAEDDLHLVEGSGDETQWVDIQTWERSHPPALGEGDEDAPSERELEPRRSPPGAAAAARTARPSSTRRRARSGSDATAPERGG